MGKRTVVCCVSAVVHILMFGQVWADTTRTILTAVVPYVYFDINSAEIPQRYVRLTPAQANVFTPDSVPPDAMMIHRNILNIMGHRMRSYSEIPVRLVGCVDEKAEGRNIDLSMARIKIVVQYLTDVWHIDPNRFVFEASGRWPRSKTNPNNDMGKFENARVEILADVRHDTLADIFYGLHIYQRGAPCSHAGVLELRMNTSTFEHHIKPRDERWIERWVVPLLQYPCDVRVVGCTDTLGEDRWNVQLSSRRARAFAYHIATLGVAKCAMVVDTAVGETQNMYPVDVPEGRNYSRAVHVTVNYRCDKAVDMYRDSVYTVAPILPYVFFDSASSIIPRRYKQFADGNQANQFVDMRARGLLGHHYEILNIIGYRLTKYPRTGIDIHGCVNERTEGRNESLSRARAQVIYDYLRKVWMIHEQRMRVVPTGAYGVPKSNPNSTDGGAENSRCEFVFTRADVDVRAMHAPIIVDRGCTAEGRELDSLRETVRLFDFDLDRFDLSKNNTRFLDEYVIGRVKQKSKVRVEYTQSEDPGRTLEKKRAWSVKSYLQIHTPLLPQRASTRIVARPVFDEALPEMRFLNRGVTIYIATPRLWVW